MLFDLPLECDQSAERMVEILEEKGLAFLFPLLHVERELSRHLQSDPSPPAFYKWVKENVSARLHGDRAFINILVTWSVYDSSPLLFHLSDSSPTFLVPPVATSTLNMRSLNVVQEVNECFL